MSTAFRHQLIPLVLTVLTAGALSGILYLQIILLNTYTPDTHLVAQLAGAMYSSA